MTQLDPLFGRLLLWTDRNRDGHSDAGELVPANSGFPSIALGYSGERVQAANGSILLGKGGAIRISDAR